MVLLSMGHEPLGCGSEVEEMTAKAPGLTGSCLNMTQTHKYREEKAWPQPLGLEQLLYRGAPNSSPGCSWNHFLWKKAKSFIFQVPYSRLTAKIHLPEGAK